MDIHWSRTALSAAVATALFAVAGAAAANESSGGPTYTYAEVGYLNLDVDGGGSLDGLRIGGSIAINPEFHILADYLRVSDGPLMLDGTTLAAGFNMPLSGTTDFVARLGWVRAGAEFDMGAPLGTLSDSDDGWMVQAGLRSMVSSELELNAFVTHTDVAGSDTAFSIGAVYSFTHAFGVFGNAEFADGGTLASVGVRFSF